MKRYKFVNTGITIEGEKEILLNLIDVIREGVEPGNQISDLIFAMEIEFEVNGMNHEGE